MPDLILSGSAHAAAAPPAAAFQPKMRILKRPAKEGPVSLPPPAVPGETLKEREARYQAARERIFGSEGDATSSPGDKKGTPAAAVGVVRNPRGPPAEAPTPTSAPKGFKARSGRPPPSPNPVRDSESMGTERKSESS